MDLWGRAIVETLGRDSDKQLAMKTVEIINVRSTSKAVGTGLLKPLASTSLLPCIQDAGFGALRFNVCSTGF